MLDAREVDFVVAGAPGLEFVDGVPERLHDGLVGPLEEFGWNADREPVDVAVGGVGQALGGSLVLAGGRVVLVWPCDHFEQFGGLLDGGRDRADLFETVGVGDESVPRDQAVGRFDADDATERGGTTNRAAGVRSERQVGVAGGHDGCRATGGATGDVARGRRVLDGAVGRRLRRRPHPELVHVGLAGNRRAGLLQSLDGRRVVRWDVPLEHRRPAGRRDALGGDVVLDGDRLPGERAVAVALDRLLGDVGVVVGRHPTTPSAP